MKTTKEKFISFYLVICIFVPIQGAKILGLFPLASRSHWNSFRPVLLELAARGHEITTVSLVKPNLQMSNIAEVEMPELAPILQKDNLQHLFDKFSNPVLIKFLTIWDMFNNICKITVNSSTIQQLLRNGMVYDLVLVNAFGNDCAVQLAPMLAKYIILISPTPTYIMLTFPYTLYPSFLPEKSFSFPPRMNFFERFQNTIGTFLGRKVFELAQRDANTIVLNAFPNASTLSEAQDKISLILFNADPVLSLPQPTTPRMINVGGMHLLDAKPLTQEFKNIVENADSDGFIVFTLGSVISSEKLPKQIQEAFLLAFSRLKLRIIWRYDGKIDNLPPNVFLLPWLPQKDLLGHPKCRLFITHGGLNGLQEAVYFGVPVVGIPIYGDQFGNLALMKYHGIGESLGELFQLNSDHIYTMMTKVLETKSYSTNMKRYSSILRDELVPPAKRAAYWVEYVLRHDGARHLRSPGEDIGFIQYFLLDVITFVILVILSGICSLIWGVKFLFRFGKSKVTKCSKSKTNL